MKKSKETFKALFLTVVAFIVCSLIVFTPYGVSAAQVVSAIATNSLTSILTNQSHIANITLANGTGVAGTVRIYDSATTNLTYSFGGYTNVVYSTSSVTNSYTDFAGVSQSIITTSLVATDVEVSAGNGTYPVLATVNVPANTILTVTLPAGGWNSNFGLAMTNDVAMSATVTYSTVR